MSDESVYEDDSFDPFSSDNSGDERDNSSGDDEEGIAERDCLPKWNFMNFVNI